MTNEEWLKELFEQSHMKRIELSTNFNCKWFYIKNGRAFYNPKQINSANPLEFKLLVLDICCQNWTAFMPG